MWLVVYATLPISAAWLLGHRAALWAVAVCLACSLTLALLEINGIGQWWYTQGRPLGLWFLLAGATVITTVPVTQMLRILQTALAQSQSAEEALRKNEHNLEETIRQRTAELAIARDQAQAANQAKSAFLADISHELHTPLNAILGFSNLTHDDRTLPEDHRRDLEIINRSGAHLLKLIDEMLDMAKIEAGRTALTITNVDPGELLRGVADMMRLRAEEKGLRLICLQSGVCPGVVRADAAKLRQVLVHLAGNAVKYSEQGSVTLRLEAEGNGDPQHVLLRFEVEDTGRGIAVEDQTRIFEPFIQLGEVTTQKGNGLGLAITRKFVELMRGTLSVESSPGNGSLFRVEVPVERAEEPEQPAAEGVRQQIIGLVPNQPDHRILIVEDRRQNCLLLQRLLEDTGFHVRVAENGAEAVELFRTWRPCFIWLDERLPDMNGLEAARCIRALEGGRDVKIVALTASGFGGQRREVLAAGLDDFVRKPCQPREIFECMARHVGTQYLYHDESACDQEPELMLPPEALAALPQDLQRQLAEAVISLDIKRIATLISLVSEQDAVLGDKLKCCAERLAYTPILNALDPRSYRTVSA
jgi:signal transduction histidine kinase/CheY-like chemotaxis protein